MFSFFPSSLSPHIFTTTATVFVVDVFFFFLKCSLFFLSLVWTLFFFFRVREFAEKQGDHVYTGGLTENAKRDDVALNN